MKWRVCFLVALFTFSALAQNLAPSPAVHQPKFITVEPEKEPFWRKKEKVWRRLREEREVVVSVKTKSTTIAGFKEELYMLGAGIVDAPLHFTYQTALKFEDYPKMSSFVKSASYNPETKILLMHTSAFNYDAYLKMETMMLEPTSSRREIRFRVLEGGFRGLTGVVSFDELTPTRSEIALTAQFAFNKLPMPKFFAEFGLEVALKLMATKMRAYVEKSLKATKAGG